ncbi:MAG: hypothetical protein LBL47_04865 [Lactobacillus sp.]|jgi:uncharacterized membrane protein|nr:hypothetical protein [Lactobacillus sp.]
MKKRTKILLTCSICLNIFFIGFLAGEIKHFRPHHKGPELVKEFQAKHAEQQKAINDERIKAVEMLKADNFNQDEYNKQVEKVGAMQQEMFQEFAIKVGEKIRSLPEDERNKVIERISKRRFDGKRPHHPKPRHDKDDAPRPPHGPEGHPEK